MLPTSGVGWIIFLAHLTPTALGCLPMRNHDETTVNGGGGGGTTAAPVTMVVTSVGRQAVNDAPVFVNNEGPSANEDGVFVVNNRQPVLLGDTSKALSLQDFLDKIQQRDRLSSTDVNSLPCISGICTGCPEGWARLPLTDSCYKVLSTPYHNWHKYEGICRGQRAHLASVHSREEMKFLSGLLLGTPFTKFYIGASTKEGSITNYGNKFTDGSTFDYTDWATDRSSDQVQTRQRCAQIRIDEYGHGKWYDASCITRDAEHTEICKRPANSTLNRAHPPRDQVGLLRTQRPLQAATPLPIVPPVSSVPITMDHKIEEITTTPIPTTTTTSAATATAATTSATTTDDIPVLSVALQPIEPPALLDGISLNAIQNSQPQNSIGEELEKAPVQSVSLQGTVRSVAKSVVSKNDVADNRPRDAPAKSGTPVKPVSSQNEQISAGQNRMINNVVRNSRPQNNIRAAVVESTTISIQRSNQHSHRQPPVNGRQIETPRDADACVNGVCGGCPPGWTQLPDTDSCYQVSTSSGHNWHRYESFCRARGGHLASIHNEEEMRTVIGFLFGTKFKKFFIGAQTMDASAKEYGAFFIDGTPMNYTNWAADRSKESIGSTQNCAQIRIDGTTRGQWYDVSCVSRDPDQTSLCKRPSTNPSHLVHAVQSRNLHTPPDANENHSGYLTLSSVKHAVTVAPSNKEVDHFSVIDNSTTTTKENHFTVINNAVNPRIQSGNMKNRNVFESKPSCELPLGSQQIAECSVGSERSTAPSKIHALPSNRGSNINTDKAAKIVLSENNNKKAADPAVRAISAIQTPPPSPSPAKVPSRSQRGGSNVRSSTHKHAGATTQRRIVSSTTASSRSDSANIASSPNSNNRSPASTTSSQPAISKQVTSSAKPSTTSGRTTSRQSPSNRQPSNVRQQGASAKLVERTPGSSASRQTVSNSASRLPSGAKANTPSKPSISSPVAKPSKQPSGSSVKPSGSTEKAPLTQNKSAISPVTSRSSSAVSSIQQPRDASSNTARSVASKKESGQEKNAETLDDRSLVHDTTVRPPTRPTRNRQNNKPRELMNKKSLSESGKSSSKRKATAVNEKLFLQNRTSTDKQGKQKSSSGARNTLSKKESKTENSLNRTATKLSISCRLKCAQGWRRFGEHCYLIHDGNDGGAWEESCLRLNARTPSIHSKAENDFLLGIAKHHNITVFVTDLAGGENLDDTPNDYSNWAQGKPTDPETTCTEVSVSVEGSVPGTWHDVPCDKGWERGICKASACEGVTKRVTQGRKKKPSRMPLNAKRKQIRQRKSEKKSNSRSDRTQCELKCAKGWTQFGEYCYMKHDGQDGGTWEESCMRQNARTPSIGSREENKFLLDFARKHKIRVFTTDLVGGENLDGLPVNYTNWAKGKPVDPENTCTEFFVDIAGTVPGTWNDTSCMAGWRRGICKASACQGVTMKINELKDGSAEPPKMAAMKKMPAKRGKCEQTKCARGWTHYQNSCYLKIDRNSSEESWHQLCSQKGRAKLANVRSLGENVFITDFAKKNSLKSVPISVPHQTKFTNWNVRDFESDNNGKNCVQIITVSSTSGGGKWEHFDCVNRHPTAICRASDCDGDTQPQS